METHYVNLFSSNGAKIQFYHTAVDRNKSNILIALPFGVRSQMANSAFEKFHPNYNVVTWESRYILNLGQEFSGSEKMTPNEHAEDMICILQALDMKKCLLIGYCSGAGIALFAARKHPGVFTKLILVNGEYQLFRQGYSSTDYQRSIDTFLPVAASSREQAKFLFSKMADISQARNNSDTSEFDSEVNLPFSREEYLYRYAINYLGYRDFKALDIAAGIEQETYVISGKKDIHSSMDSSEAIHKSIRSSNLYINNSGDHYDFCRHDSRTLNKIDYFIT